MGTQFTTLTKSTGEVVQLDLLGNWDASTNTPTLVSSTGTIGQTYRVSVAGTTTLNGISSWAVEDYVYFDGSAWQKDDHNNRNLRASALGVSGTSTLSPAQVITNPNAGTSSQMVYFMARVVAFANPPGAPPAADDTACWTIEGCIIRDQSTGTVSFPAAPVVTPLYNPNPTDWEVLAVADDSVKSLKINVTVDGFGGGPGAAPPASFFADLTLVPAGTPL